MILSRPGRAGVALRRKTGAYGDPGMDNSHPG